MPPLEPLERFSGELGVGFYFVVRVANAVVSKNLNFELQLLSRRGRGGAPVYLIIFI